MTDKFVILRYSCLSLIRVAFSAACMSANANQTAVVTIQAVDPRGNAISGIEVSLYRVDSGLRLRATTDSQGLATFEVSEAGEWVLVGQPLGSVPPAPVQVMVSRGRRMNVRLIVDPTIVDTIQVQ
jgi:hypothetical protein